MVGCRAFRKRLNAELGGRDQQGCQQGGEQPRHGCWLLCCTSGGPLVVVLYRGERKESFFTCPTASQVSKPQLTRFGETLRDLEVHVPSFTSSRPTPDLHG